MGCVKGYDDVATAMKSGIQSPSIRMVFPPKTTAGQPSTLTQAKKMVLGHMAKHLRDAPLPHDRIDDPEALMNLLERLSTQYRTHHFFCSDPIRSERMSDFLGRLRERQSTLRLSIACVFDGEHLPNAQIENGCENIVQIQWVVKGAVPDIRVLKPFSKAGTWNHMVFSVDEMASAECSDIIRQPNILHSFQIAGTYQHDHCTTNVYGHVSPLPGRPLWKSLSDPVDRFLFVDRLTKERLLRMRVDDDGESIYTVGDSLTYHFVQPNRLPGAYLDEICAMVAAGGTVATTHVRNNLKQAFLIAYVKERGAIVSNSSLKRPRPAYIEMVRRKSGLDLTGYLERGYTSVRPEYRGMGIATKLLEGLTRRAGEHKIFSVIGEDNAATKIIAKRNRTRKVATYFSDKAGKPVGIWMPEWMIETRDPKTP